MNSQQTYVIADPSMWNHTEENKQKQRKNLTYLKTLMQEFFQSNDFRSFFTFNTFQHFGDRSNVVDFRDFLWVLKFWVKYMRTGTSLASSILDDQDARTLFLSENESSESFQMLVAGISSAFQVSTEGRVQGNFNLVWPSIGSSSADQFPEGALVWELRWNSNYAIDVFQTMTQVFAKKDHATCRVYLKLVGNTYSVTTNNTRKTYDILGYAPRSAVVYEFMGFLRDALEDKRYPLSDRIKKRVLFSADCPKFNMHRLVETDINPKTSAQVMKNGSPEVYVLFLGETVDNE